MIFWKRPTKEIDSCELVGLSDRLKGQYWGKDPLMGIVVVQE